MSNGFLSKDWREQFQAKRLSKKVERKIRKDKSFEKQLSKLPFGRKHIASLQSTIDPKHSAYGVVSSLFKSGTYKPTTFPWRGSSYLLKSSSSEGGGQSPLGPGPYKPTPNPTPPFKFNLPWKTKGTVKTSVKKLPLD